MGLMTSRTPKEHAEVMKRIEQMGSDYSGVSDNVHKNRIRRKIKAREKALEKMKK